ncbi:MAG TPA: NUDIX hydrolase [Gammaproteobacteria bacterium]|jgi:8-oxo-dGTP pyrophosphatase MutT (NUDIX family)|nr:NUDIX hydrolase [Gammaproteobacteria bacterium]
MVWKPHVTVAAIAEQDGRFLVVEEEVRGRRVFNNPAGHLEPGESFLEAVQREALEETGWEFTPDAVTGIYLWKNPELDATFVRVAFHGCCARHHAGRALDKGIVGPHWLSRAELADGTRPLRSPMVLRCIDDALAGRRYPLDLLSHVTDLDSTLEDA